MELCESTVSHACRIYASFHARYPPWVTSEAIASRKRAFNRDECAAGEPVCASSGDLGYHTVSPHKLHLNLHVNVKLPFFCLVLNPQPCSVWQDEDPAAPAANLDDSVEGDSSLYEEGSIHRPVGCLGLLESLSERLHIGQDEPAPLQHKARSRRHPQQLQGSTVKPEAGASLMVRIVHV